MFKQKNTFFKILLQKKVFYRLQKVKSPLRAFTNALKD